MVLLSSCSMMFQRAYIASAPNINYFEKENEKNLKLTLFLNHYEAQSNFALSKNIGLYTGINGGFRKQIGCEIAGIYYKKLNDKNYFETQAGYGYFSNTSTITDLPWDMGAMIEHGTWYSMKSNTIYHKFFIQPTYIYNLNSVNYGFAIKLSANYFDKYYYYHCFSENPEDNFITYDTYSTGDFQHKWSFACEPSYRVQYNSKLYLQLSGIIISNFGNSQLIHGRFDHSQLTDEKVIGISRNPQHLYFLFTIGYEIKFGKKK